MEIPTFKFKHTIILDKVSYSREQKYYFIYFLYTASCSFLKFESMCKVYLWINNYLKGIEFLNMQSDVMPVRISLYCQIQWNAYISFEYEYMRFSQFCEKWLLVSSCLSLFLHVCLSVCPSARPPGTTRLPLEGFLWILKFEYF